MGQLPQQQQTLMTQQLMQPVQAAHSLMLNNRKKKEMRLERIEDYRVHENYGTWEFLVREQWLQDEEERQLYDHAKALQASSWGSFLWQMFIHPIAFYQRRSMYRRVQTQIKISLAAEEYCYVAGLLTQSAAQQNKQEKEHDGAVFPANLDQLKPKQLIALHQQHYQPLKETQKSKKKRGVTVIETLTPLTWLKTKGLLWFKKAKSWFSDIKIRLSVGHQRFQTAWESGVSEATRAILIPVLPPEVSPRVLSSSTSQLVAAASVQVQASIASKQVVSTTALISAKANAEVPLPSTELIRKEAVHPVDATDALQLLLFRLGFLGIELDAKLTPEVLDQQMVVFKTRVDQWYQKELRNWLVPQQTEAFSAKDQLFKMISNELLPYIKGYFFQPGVRQWMQKQSSERGMHWYRQCKEWISGHDAGIGASEVLTMQGITLAFHEANKWLKERVDQQSEDIRELRVGVAKFKQSQQEDFQRIENRIEAMNTFQDEIAQGIVQTRVESQKTAQCIEEQTQRLQQLESIVQQLVLAQGIIPVAAAGTTSAPAAATRAAPATPASTDYSGVSPRLFVVSDSTAASVPTADSKNEAATRDALVPAIAGTDADATAAEVASASCS